MTTKMLIAGLALASFAFAAPASAGQFRFYYSPQEVETFDGRAAMMERLESRASRYCRMEYARGLNTRRAKEACKKDVIKEIAGKIGNVEFAALQ